MFQLRNKTSKVSEIHMRRFISNLFMFAIIPTKLKQMQSGPKYCGREIFHKYLGGLQTKRICLGICCHGTFRKFSHQITEYLYDQSIKYFTEDNAFPRASLVNLMKERMEYFGHLRLYQC